ncbi:ROK family protein [Flavisolibacter sp. BT320]|nr:ROK family protein [Flavisolibacter longurius]
MVESLAIGVDIGGSHITSAIVDLNSQCILMPTINRRSVNAMAGAEEIISAWSSVIAQSCHQLAQQPVKIGIAMPGPFDYEEGIAYMQEQNKYDALYGLNIKSLLSEKLSIERNNISFMNDAACFLKGEVFGGAAKGCHKVLGLTLGTGFGSAVYHNNFVYDANLWCDPYAGGIAEDLFSTRWFVKRYFELTQQMVVDVKEMMDNAEVDLVKRIFHEFGRNLGLYLRSIQNKFDFETVVVGGNIAKSFALFVGALQQEFLHQNLQVDVKPAILNEDAALLGAASVWKTSVVNPVTINQKKPATI